ncbi:HEAT repeat domain-containing protein [Rubripirellula reticaptiva]|uniref:HEAT repeat protein n=1 Tax=Rubripirellula reticaptiva TaxID=2528013 RepID=A0A5C6ELM3_9BACT|nr:hypothetical protein [Rubripirellula reticaptiva]TWU49385.1 hypothetical protein Poly59_40000 [Rubripirellula reticaptiva]
MSIPSSDRCLLVPHATRFLHGRRWLLSLRFAAVFGVSMVAAGPWTPNSGAQESDTVNDAADLIGRQLLEQSGRGNAGFADSVASLARTGRWAGVDQLLVTLADKKLSAADAAAMAARIGSDVFFRIKQSDQVSDAAKANLDKIGEALSAQMASPDRIIKAIELLDRPSADQRLPAVRTILAGGNVAIAQLVAAAVADRSASSHEQILSVLNRFGTGGPDALRQLALYGSPIVRQRSIEALATIDATAFVSDFVTSLHAQDSSESERSAAALALTPIAPSMPSLRDSIELLSDDLDDKVELASSIDNDDQTRTIWMVNADRNGVTDQTTQAMLAAYRDAADAALRLRRLGVDSIDIDAATLAASLAYRVVIDPDWGDPKQIQQVRTLWAPAIRENTLMRAIEFTTSSNLAGSSAGTLTSTTNTPALIGLIRLFADTTSSIDADAALRSHGSKPTRLVELAWSPVPRVRYEAAELVSTIANSSAYPGSSRVKQTLAEMARLSDQPKAIVVETRSAVSNRFEQLIAEMGWDSAVVGSVSALEREVSQGGDVRMILSKIQLSDLAPVEMVDVVRRSSRGGEIPILFYDDDGVAGDADGIGVSLDQSRWTAPIMLVDPPVSTSGFDAMISQVESRRRLPAMSVLDRQRYRRSAKELMASGDSHR